ncbi:MAG: hypothetical protein RBT62_03010 [Spirochaetia bacterium]|jgi:hypothetical protein|nr:hypothetical protein [Spirochaetia bacterium]
MSGTKGNPKKLLFIAGAGALIVAGAVILVLGLYSGSQESKTTLIARYFRAVEAGDELALKDMTVPGFQSDIGIVPLKRGSYELYDFGQQSEDVYHFLIIAPGVDGKKQAQMGEINFKRRGFSRRLESLRLISSGIRIKE